MSTPPAASPPRASILDLAAVFLRLGATAFGGPAAHIAMMQEEVVRRRGWLTRAEFVDLLGAAQLVPGPNSTELAIHVGHSQRGMRGLLVAGACFVMPAVLIVSVLAAVYVRVGRLPVTDAVFHGMRPVVLAIVVQALLAIGHTALRRPALALIAAASCAALALGAHELLVLVAAGVAALVIARPHAAATWAPIAAASPLAAPAAAAPFALAPLFLFFLKVGAVLFGSGYVLLAFLRADLVERWHWLTDAQLLDAITVGQITPGPVFTTATFVGWLLAGPAGATVATVGIFLPAFVYVAVSGPLVPRLRRSRAAGAFLDGVNAASVALLAWVAWGLGRHALVDAPTVALALAAGLLLWRTRVHSAWLLLGGAVVGWVVRAVG